MEGTGSKADVLRETAERAEELGAAVLTDAELVGLLVGDPEAAQRLVTRFNVRRLHQAPPAELEGVDGIGKRRAAVLVAALELGRRLWPDEGTQPVVRGPESIHELTKDLRELKREHFVGFYLDSRNSVLRRETISIGSLNASIVHPREVFLPAVALSAASVVICHNHPSGDPTPSEEDLAITRRLTEAGRILGIDLLDHVVVSRTGYASFKERRLLRP